MYNEVILDVVNNKIDSILQGDNVLPGHNGPYYDEETDVRNLAHWIQLCACCHKLTENEKYKSAVKILAEKLLQSSWLNSNYVYISRISKKDSINGTVGPAWIIEGLVKAYKVLGEEKYLNLAEKIFKAQKFVPKNSLWTRINENRKDIGFDLTYNHELWFAAAGSMLLDCRYDKIIDQEIQAFLTMSIKGLRVLPDGIINHYVDTWVGVKRAISFNKQYFLKLLKDKFGKPTMRYKEEGYHLFSMYAFALLYERYKDHDFFKSKKFQKALKVTFDEKLYSKLENSNPKLDSTSIGKKNIDKRINAYAYPYNAPGFELPYIAMVFMGKDDGALLLAEKVFQKQLQLTYDEGTRTFLHNTEDGIVLTARLYELTRAIQ